MSNIGMSTRHRHVGCLNYEGKVIKPTNFKLVAKYIFSQAPSNLKFLLAGSGGDFRTGLLGQLKMGDGTVVCWDGVSSFRHKSPLKLDTVRTTCFSSGVKVGLLFTGRTLLI